MRLKEIQAKTPQQQRIDALKRSADITKNTYKNEKKKLQIQQTQQRLQKLKSVGALGS
jgi:hypothetical protein